MVERQKQTEPDNRKRFVINPDLDVGFSVEELTFAAIGLMERPELPESPLSAPAPGYNRVSYELENWLLTHPEAKEYGRKIKEYEQMKAEYKRQIRSIVRNLCENPGARRHLRKWLDMIEGKSESSRGESATS